MARRKKGMFGKSTGYAMPSQWDVRPDMPMGRPQTNYPMPSQWDVQPQEKKPGFFDKGGASQYVFAGIQDFLQRRMDEQPTGVANLLYRQQQEQQARAEAAAAQRKRAMDLADYEAKKGIDARYDTQKPTSLQQNYEWLLQTDPEAAEAYKERMTNNYQYRQGADGRFYRIDIGDQQPQVLGSELPQGWTVEGGSGGNAGGGF